MTDLHLNPDRPNAGMTKLKEAAAIEMKLFTWNMRSGGARKWPLVEAGRSDIAVLQECARPEILERSHPGIHKRWTLFWDGDRDEVGLLVAVRAGLSATLRSVPDRSIKHALAVDIDGARPVRLLGVHSYNHRAATRGGSPTPLPDALNLHAAWLASGPSIVAGDFNNQPSFERYTSDARRAPNRWSNILRLLSELGLSSAYHRTTGEAFGGESSGTFFRSRSDPSFHRYHIDYVFASDDLLNESRCEIGDFDTWIASGRSDHAPLIFTTADSRDVDAAGLRMAGPDPIQPEPARRSHRTLEGVTT